MKLLYRIVLHFNLSFISFYGKCVFFCSLSIERIQLAYWEALYYKSCLLLSLAQFVIETNIKLQESCR